MVRGFYPMGSANEHCSICPVRRRGICGGFTKEDREALAKKSNITFVRSGSSILNQDEDCNRVGIIISGVAKGVYYTSEGNVQLLRFSQPGELIGAPIASKNGVSTEAATDMLLCSITNEALNVLLRDRLSLYPSYFNFVSNRLESEQVWHAELRQRSTIERLAFWLMAQIPSDKQPAEPVINIQFTRRDLAAYLNMSAETLCRALGRLVSLEAITLPNPCQVDVRDTAKLGSLAKS